MSASKLPFLAFPAVLKYNKISSRTPCCYLVHIPLLLLLRGSIGNIHCSGVNRLIRCSRRWQNRQPRDGSLLDPFLIRLFQFRKEFCPKKDREVLDLLIICGWFKGEDGVVPWLEGDLGVVEDVG